MLRWLAKAHLVMAAAFPVVRPNMVQKLVPCLTFWVLVRIAPLKYAAHTFEHSRSGWWLGAWDSLASWAWTSRIFFL